MIFTHDYFFGTTSRSQKPESVKNILIPESVMIPHVCDFEGISINHSLWKMYGSIAGHLTIPSMFHTTSDLKILIQNQNCYSSCRSAASAAEQIPPLRRSFEPVIQKIPNENILYRKSLINSTDLLVPIYIGKTLYKAYRGTIFTDSGQFGTGCQKVDSGRVMAGHGAGSYTHSWTLSAFDPLLDASWYQLSRGEIFRSHATTWFLRISFTNEFFTDSGF